MHMVQFLVNYNLNDVRLLTAAIDAYSKKCLEVFGLGAHGGLSIAQLAQTAAFMHYDEQLPPIISPPKEAESFYNDLRENLTGGICQSVHRAVNLNGPSDDLPKELWQSTNGEAFCDFTIYDFNALYGHMARQPLPIGAGMLYKRQTSNFNNFRATPLYRKKENPSLESIRYLEYLNKNFMGDRIKHAYNFVEKKIGRYSIDGFATLSKIFTNSDGEHIVQKLLVEYNGCHFHPCPLLSCKKVLYKSARTRRVSVNGKFVNKVLSTPEIVQLEIERIHSIVDTLREQDKMQDWGKPTLDGQHVQGLQGPQNFHHVLRIKYHCEWVKEKSIILRKRPEMLYSADYPFLFDEVVGENDVRETFARRIEGNKTQFFGFIMVDLKATQEVYDRHPEIPPIFARVKLEAGDCQGHIDRIIPPDVKKRMFPKEDNIFCYNKENYLCTSDMLAYLIDQGYEYEIKYFVNYYRGAPFANFVNKMVKERIECEKRATMPAQTSNHRFVNTKIVGADRLRECFESSMFKAYKPIRVEDVAMDPLHEVVMRKSTVIENLALHIQVAIYQNSKLHLLQFKDIIKDFMIPGTVKFCYCDTDSLAYARTRATLKECVKPHLVKMWEEAVEPQWFAGESVESQKEPGLLKEEASIQSGWFLTLSPKCYALCPKEPCELEKQIVDPRNEHRTLEILHTFAQPVREPKITKKSTKGCKTKIQLSMRGFRERLSETVEYIRRQRSRYRRSVPLRPPRNPVDADEKNDYELSPEELDWYYPASRNIINWQSESDNLGEGTKADIKFLNELIPNNNMESAYPDPEEYFEPIEEECLYALDSPLQYAPIYFIRDHWDHHKMSFAGDRWKRHYELCNRYSITLLNTWDIQETVRKIAHNLNGLLRVQVDAFYTTISSRRLRDRQGNLHEMSPKVRIVYPNTWGSVNDTELLVTPADIDQLVHELEPDAFKNKLLINTFQRRNVFQDSNVRLHRLLAYQVVVYTFPPSWIHS
ncbi:Oidioi.mRNA.OKI2018_I69.YSR.g17166.t1.cds [Oikopleura dioica]|uniref:Oidioi.mRNA.OKI2018_I69.YSR.g17166.t1.cds n=1 Tax=Oikopleura dioica TaxID=34765 RepID=A0ABN7SID0_OIKDI|nr:Oidioi.mRNA.OKI2018_I69.YSR.g17166.t1.cds [Oikopleura dioica]